MNQKQEALCRNALYAVDETKSLVHDILTGPSDEWAKTQLLEALGEVSSNLWKALA